MPRVRTGDKGIVAVLTADWHLSYTAPRARAEEDWLSVIDSVMDQLRTLQGNEPIPIIVAGDLFDRHNPPLALVNSLLRMLPPNLFAIPGNHDLPHHRFGDMFLSAFGTMVEAGRVRVLLPKQPFDLSTRVSPLRIHSFPCGFAIKPLKDPHDLVLEIAVVHEYFWTKKTGHAQASPKQRLGRQKERFAGYDVVVVGDNHIPWSCELSTISTYNCITTVFNAGSLFRRTIDQINHKPSVGLLHPDGSVTRHYLDCSRDQFRSEEELRGLQPYPLGDLSEFIENVGQLQTAVLDFRSAVEQVLEQKQVTKVIKRIVLQALEGKT